jgi:nicotinamidase-related amidase
VPLRGLDAGERTALIINECQRGLVDAVYAGPEGLAGEVARRQVIRNIAGLAATCRELGVPVVHSTIVMRPDGIGTQATCLLLGVLVKNGTVVAGRPEADVMPELGPEAGDIVSQRVHGLSPFHGTELEWLLRDLGVVTVIVTGVSTNIGIPGACLEAVNRGLRAVVPADAVAGAWPEAQEWNIRHTLPLLATVSTTAEVDATLRAAGPQPLRP